MIELVLIGIGSGDPEHMTLQGVRALNAADLVLIPRKGEEKAALADLRRDICRAVLTNPATRLAEFDLPVRDAANPDYLAGVDAWHDAIAAVWAREIRSNLGESGRVAFLVWGDPSLYDSTLRIAGRVARVLPVAVRVIPGITALQALTAAHGIPLNSIGAPVVITTGRKLREAGWPAGADSVAVMLDGGEAFAALPGDGITVWWGAYVGMPMQVLRSGPLADVGPEIAGLREELRARHGWIMDIYLLRREPADGH